MSSCACAPLHATQDVDSTVDVKVNGEKIDKMKRVQLKPGAVLQAGDDVCFQGELRASVLQLFQVTSYKF